MPNTSPILLGAMPRPVQAPAVIVLELVTKGYEPKSTSNNDPWAPSANIDLLSLIALFTVYSESTILKVFMNSTAS